MAALSYQVEPLRFDQVLDVLQYNQSSNLVITRNVVNVSGVRDQDWQQFVAKLQDNTSLRALAITDVALTAAYTQMLVAALLGRATPLQYLRIRNANLSATACNHLAPLLINNVGLVILDVSGNAIDVAGFTILINALRGNSTLCKLTIGNVVVNDDDLQPLLEMLRSSTQLVATTRCYSWWRKVNQETIPPANQALLFLEGSGAEELASWRSIQAILQARQQAMPAEVRGDLRDIEMALPPVASVTHSAPTLRWVTREHPRPRAHSCPAICGAIPDEDITGVQSEPSSGDGSSEVAAAGVADGHLSPAREDGIVPGLGGVVDMGG